MIRVGRARSTLYALARKITGEGYRVPLFQINKSGAVIKAATLSFLVNGGTVIEQAGKSPLPYWLAGVSNNAYFEGFPYFLIDLKPEGFLGKEIARALSGMGRTLRTCETGVMKTY